MLKSSFNKGANMIIFALEISSFDCVHMVSGTSETSLKQALNRLQFSAPPHQLHSLLLGLDPKNVHNASLWNSTHPDSNKTTEINFALLK